MQYKIEYEHGMPGTGHIFFRIMFFILLCIVVCIANCGHSHFLSPTNFSLSLPVSHFLSLSLSLSVSLFLFFFFSISIPSCLYLFLPLSLFRYLTFMFRSSYNIGRRCQLFILIDVPLLQLKQNLSQKEFLKVVHNFFLCYFIFFI